MKATSSRRKPDLYGRYDGFCCQFPQFVEVETDDKGMVPEALEKVLKYSDRVRLMYASS